MIHFDIPKPNISPDFTVDDLHKIREWNYERFKDATPEERRQHYRQIRERMDKEMQIMRSKEAA
ncbi:MAG: hypothetical protein FWC27_09630 [Firmicutes bacterium]|nr:hypothetical protein [Bacillota bacterium]